METMEILDRAEISGDKVVVEYSRTEAALADLRGKYQGVAYDLTTTKGDKEARAARLELTTLRTSLEKKRKEFKAPALEFGKKIDSEAARITAEIVALETPIDQQIKADESRRAAEKAERERLESERIAGLREKISAIRGFVAKCNGITSERIANGIELVGQSDVSAEVFAELHPEAEQAKAETLLAMGEAYAAAQHREAEAAKVEAQRLENERISEQQQIQAEAIAAKQAELDRQAKAIEEATNRMLLETQAREAEHAKIRAEAAQKALDDAMPPMNFTAEREKVEITIELETFTAPPAIELLPAPTLKLSAINEKLGFSVSTEFLASLGFHFTQIKAAKMYQESDMKKIAEKIAHHCFSVAKSI